MERNIDVREKDWLVAPCTPTRDQTCDTSRCLDREPNQQCFALWDDAQPTEPPGQDHSLSFSCQISKWVVNPHPTGLFCGLFVDM